MQTNNKLEAMTEAEFETMLLEIEELGLQGVLDKYAPLDTDFGRMVRAVYAQNPLLEQLMMRGRKCQ
jgi:hypothetical protein